MQLNGRDLNEGQIGELGLALLDRRNTLRRRMAIFACSAKDPIIVSNTVRDLGEVHEMLDMIGWGDLS